MKTKILKLRKYREGLTEKEENELLNKKGCRRLNPDDFISYCQGKEYDDYLPCRLKPSVGPLARGDDSDYDGRRYVVANYGPSDSLGVLGIKKDGKNRGRL